MQFEYLPNELVLHVFSSCSSVPDVLNLASTCHHFRKVLTTSRLPILFQAAEAQFGPLSDAIQLVTHNTSQSAHIHRPSPPFSIALLTRLLSVGYVANKWAAIFPTRKWRGAFSPSRRLLSSTERYRLRRALYRLWLYALAFHDPLHSRTSRHLPPVVRSRAALLRPWLSNHLAEMLDLHAIFRDVLTFQICPSNGTVLRRHRARFPDNPAPVLIHPRLSQHDSHSVQIIRQQHQQQYLQDNYHGTPHFLSESFNKSQTHSDAAEGWGDEITHYYVVEDMLKLNPEQLLLLYDSANGATPFFEAATTRSHVTNGYTSPAAGDGRKASVERFVAGLGDWFENNGETLGETVDWVVNGRGEDVVVLREEVRCGVLGIVREEGGVMEDGGVRFG